MIPEPASVPVSTGWMWGTLVVLTVLVLLVIIGGIRKKAPIVDDATGDFEDLYPGDYYTPPVHGDHALEEALAADAANGTFSGDFSGIPLP